MSVKFKMSEIGVSQEERKDQVGDVFPYEIPMILIEANRNPIRPGGLPKT